MPTTVTFENALLADAVAKASRIAPRKGKAFDLAAGIVFEVDPSTAHATVKATDLEVTYEQRIPVLDSRGDPATWRIPSSILAGITSNLPLAEGAAVEFIDRGDPSTIRFKSGKMIAKLATLSYADFPTLPTFDTDGMTPAQLLANKIEQVSWATEPKSPVLSGVHLDGQRLIGCNQHILAVVPCEVMLDNPVTVPLGTLSSILKNATDIRVRAVGQSFQLMLDAETKATTRILEGMYPKIDGLMRDDFTGSVTIHRQQFVDTLERMMVMVQNEKSPSLSLEFDGTGIVKMLTFDIEISRTGRMRDQIDIQTDTFDGQFRIFFVPSYIQDAVSKLKSDYFQFSFGHSDPTRANKMPVRVSDDTGYFSYVSVKVPPTT